MEIQAIDTVTAAFVAGCVTSVHCAGMCGPLACAVTMSRPGEESTMPPQVASTLYHLGRMLLYTALGALAGFFGRAPLEWLLDSPAALLPWLLVLGFLAVALGLDRKIPRPVAVGRAFSAVRVRLSRLRWAPPALALGVGTPLLPCGPLYLMIGAALVTGSALRGAEFSLAFGLGTVPLLWVAQSQFGMLQKRFGPGGVRRLQRGAALVAALVIAWRLRGAFGFVEGGAPCCH